MEGSHRHATLPLLQPRFLTPAGLRWGTFPRPDGTTLRWAYLAGPEARVACVLLGGFGEFAEKYFETMADLASRGMAVWFLDWRGQGGSTRPQRDPNRPRARDFVRDAGDLAAFVAAVLPAESRRVVIAHSMGAAIALLALAQRPQLFDAAVLSAPMVGLDTRPVPSWLAPAIAAVPTWCGLGGVFAPGRGPWRNEVQVAARNLATRDPIRAGIAQAWCLAAPALRLDGPTFAWVHAALGLARRLNDPRLLRRIRLPVLIGCPGDEYVVDPPAIRRVAHALPCCELESLPAARHELFTEVDGIRNRWLAAITRFLRPLISQRPIQRLPRFEKRIN